MVVTQLPAQRAARQAHQRDWWRSAACREADPELFFPVAPHGPGAGEIARAKAVCAGCEVRRECLQYALATRQLHGVWGGTTEGERQLQVRKDNERAAALARPARPGRAGRAGAGKARIRSVRSRP